jgi:hypothetical protein
MADPVQKQHIKDVSAFKTGQIVGLHQAGKSTLEMSQITDVLPMNYATYKYKVKNGRRTTICSSELR